MKTNIQRTVIALVSVILLISYCEYNNMKARKKIEIASKIENQKKEIQNSAMDNIRASFYARKFTYNSYFIKGAEFNSFEKLTKSEIKGVEITYPFINFQSFKKEIKVIYQNDFKLNKNWKNEGLDFISEVTKIIGRNEYFKDFNLTESFIINNITYEKISNTDSSMVLILK